VKGCLKLFLATTGLILILPAVALLLAVAQTDTYARTPLERLFSHATGTAVTIDSVGVVPFSPTLRFEGITIMNPPALPAKPAIEVDTLTIEFDPHSLFSKTPTIREASVDGATVHLRYNVGQGTNIGDLTELASQNDEELPTPEDDNAAPDLDAARAETKWRFVVDSFQCRNVKVDLSANVLPVGEASFEIAPFSLNDDVTNSPMTTRQVTAVFLKTLLRETLTLKGLLKPVGSLVGQELQSLVSGSDIP
jgi:uncharacterized protein involved in outer membrane biogenesis